MKILRFNEGSDSKKIDIEYLNNCFIDIIDRSNIGFKISSHNTFSIQIEVIRSKKNESIDIDKALSDIDLIKSQLLEIKDAIEKIKIEYPDTDVKLVGGYTKYIVTVYGDYKATMYDGEKQIIDIPFPSHWNVKHKKEK